MLQTSLRHNRGPWLPSRTTWGFVKKLKTESLKFFKAIMLECVPDVVLALPYVSASGTRDTVGVPKAVLSAVASKYIGLCGGPRNKEYCRGRCMSCVQALPAAIPLVARATVKIALLA